MGVRMPSRLRLILAGLGVLLTLALVYVWSLGMTSEGDATEVVPIEPRSELGPLSFDGHEGPGATAVDPARAPLPLPGSIPQPGAAIPAPAMGISVYEAASLARAIPGVRLSMNRPGGEGWELGVTNELGRWVGPCETPLPDECWVLAHGAGYAPEVTYPADDCPPDVRIALRPLAWIQGVVVDQRQRPVGQGTEVIAIPETRWIRTAAQLEALRAGHFAGSWAITDESGRFVLDGLAQGVGHHVLAGGSGYASPFRAIAVAGSNEDLVLEVRPLVGALLEVRGSDGAVPRGSLGDGDGIFLTFPRDSYVTVDADRLGPLRIALAGISDFLPQDPQPWDRLALALPAKDMDSLPPVPFAVRWPGYADVVDGSLPLRPILEGLPVERVPLAATHQGLGRLRVDFRTDTPATSSHASGARPDLALLELSGVEDDSYRSFWIDSFSEPKELSILPGRYRMILTSKMQLGTTFPLDGGDREIDVDAFEVTLVAFDVGAVGSIRLEPRSTKGWPYDGPLNVMVERAFPPGEYLNLIWPRPPYEVAGFPEGDYRFRVLWPWSSDEFQTREALTVAVRPGARSVLALVYE
jgi:hypothetical protein